MLEILLLAISKDILSNWLKDEPNLLQRISEEFIDKCSEFSDQNKPENDLSIEKIANSIVQKCKPLLDIEAGSLEESSKEAIILEVVNTLKACQITSETLVNINLDENRLTKLFQANETDTTRLFSQSETDLYHRLLLEISRAVIVNFSQLPEFKSARDAKLLKQSDATATESSYTQNQLNDIKNKLSEVLRSQNNNKKDVQEILAEAEANNPGLRFQILETSGFPPIIICTAKGQKISPEIGTLSFPNTESGKIGQQKYKDLIERDITANFNEGEANWNWSIQLPKLGNGPMSLRDFSLTGQKFAGKTLPVKIEFIGERDEVLHEIGYASLKVERLGAKEQEVSIFGNNVPGIVIFTSNQDTRETSISHIAPILDKSLETISDLKAIAKTLDFRVLLAESKQVKVIHLESEQLVFCVGGNVFTNPDSLKYLKAKANIFRWFAVINQFFNKFLLPPDELDNDTYISAEEIFLIITQGELESGRGQINIQYRLSDINQIIDSYLEFFDNPDDKADFKIFGSEMSATLLNETFDLGKAEITLKECSFVEDINVLKDRFSLAQENDLVNITMNYQFSYSKYLAFISR